MNPFTDKRPVPWVQQMEKHRRVGENVRKALENPTRNQVRELNLKTDFRRKPKYTPTENEGSEE